MREIEIDGGRHKVRGLTRAEINTLAADGLPISRWGLDLNGLGSDPKAAELFDAVIKLGCVKTVKLDDLTPAAERALMLGIIKETYGDEDEEKNLSRSGNGTQTGSE